MTESDEIVKRMKPEEEARQKIDQMLIDAGWKVVCREEFSPSEPCAVCETPTQGAHRADYVLFIDGRAIAVIEAKRVEVDLDDAKIQCEVAEQAEEYARTLLPWMKAWAKPLPIVYLSNGDATYLKIADSGVDYVPVRAIQSPKEMLDSVAISAGTSRYAALPSLSPRGLRACQHEAITGLEASLKRGKRRALISLATGAGKTFTACLAAYRLMEYAKFRRVLFLVDRTNLGRQALGEFGRFRLTRTGDPFTSLYATDILRASTAGSKLQMTISTIQRLYAALTGGTLAEDDEEDENDECNGAEPQITLAGLDESVKLPRDYFDLIIVDECHRSIYSHWGAVLNYFDSAVIVGLTATPVEETYGFFENNVVAHYTLDQSVVDGVNVGCEFYSILTEAATTGGAIKAGDRLVETANRSGKTEEIVAEEASVYASADLDVRIENPEQIRLVLETYRDRVYSDLYPERDPDFASLPKTLIFAKSESHARRIVEIAREVFAGQNPRFVQQITYSAPNPEELIRSFRNDREFRIAVTVTLVATGTDVKPLEVLLFMRRVGDLPLFIQMQGRAVRRIDDGMLQAVTPNAICKDRCYVVDAVGLQPTPRGEQRPLPPPPVPFEQMLEQMAHGNLPDEYLTRLANRLAYRANNTPARHLEEFAKLAKASLQELAGQIFEAVPKLPPFDPGGENEERGKLVAFFVDDLPVRRKLLEIVKGYRVTLLPGEDALITVGFSRDEATARAEKFEQCLREYEDANEAIHLIATNAAITYDDLKTLEDWLVRQDSRFTVRTMWNVYRILNKEKVAEFKTQNERIAVTNLIALVRYALRLSPRLVPFLRNRERRFNLWCGQTQRGELTSLQRKVMEKVCDYVLTNGAMRRADFQDTTDLAQAVRAFGSPKAVDEVLANFSAFMLKADAAA